MKQKKTLLVVFALALCTLSLFAGNYPKREFRGAWIQCVNGQYLGKTPAQLRSMLSSQLDVLRQAGINAIFFQVRAEGDALYNSPYEPWSRYLTGQQGQAPDDGWDPLEWMVSQCHQRSMECHAWINPYRAKTKGTTQLAPNHAAVQHPEWTFTYGDLRIFNPAITANRQHTCKIIKDIITRYDVDGLHMDDYFYPYPEAGIQIPDEVYFARYPQGFTNIADWRRNNVNLLIRDIHQLIRSIKPWVKFGISPFGIYRNQRSGDVIVEGKKVPGSATTGLQNYDDLYADVILWQEKGWVDYLLPQIYWNIGTTAADYKILCRWWNDHSNNRPLYIGQDVERTVKGTDPANPSAHQMEAKYQIQRSLPNIGGSCQWYAAAVVNNPGLYRTSLERRWHKYPALQPLMPFIDSKAPGKVKKLKVDVKSHPGSIYLTWEAPKAKTPLDEARQYVVYRFTKGEKPTVKSDDASHIVAIVSTPSYQLRGDQQGYTFLVTALDRLHNESKPAKIRL